jgi:hypothetical protein
MVPEEDSDPEDEAKSHEGGHIELRLELSINESHETLESGLGFHEPSDAGSHHSLQQSMASVQALDSAFASDAEETRSVALEYSSTTVTAISEPRSRSCSNPDSSEPRFVRVKRPRLDSDASRVPDPTV